MKRLIIVVDVDNVDPTVHDPFEIAELVLNDDNEALADYLGHVGFTGSDAPDFTHVAASWIDGDPLRAVVAEAVNLGDFDGVAVSVPTEAMVDVFLARLAAHDWPTP